MRNKLFFTLTLLLFSACSSVPKTVPLKFPEPLRQPFTEIEQIEPIAIPQTQDSEKKPQQTQFGSVPRMPDYASHQRDRSEKADNVPKLTGQAVQINVDSLPLPAFINEVYGNVLGLSFEIDAGLQNKRDLVTLRVTEPQKPIELYRLAEQVLDNYGVSITQQGQLLRFIPTKNAPAGEPPLLVQGTTLPSVPNSHRPIFQFIPLKVVQNAMVRAWIRDAYKGQQLEVSEDMIRNAIILRGKPEIVAQAAEAVKILDQPLMRGRYSTLIEPAFLSVNDLNSRLTSVLTAEGYMIGNNAPIIFIPFQSNNSLLVFSADKTVLNHIKAWAIKLDQPLPNQDKGKQRIYYYSVKNTTASGLGAVLSQLLDLSNQTVGGRNNQNPQQSNPNAKNRLVVDETRNILIFHGDTGVWSQALPIIKKLDTPAKQVLIEVTIAEISLTDDTQFGIEWTMKEAGLGSFKGDIEIGGFGIGSDGFYYAPLSSSGQARAVLNAFANNNQVTVLSTPTIMVRSGESASFNVGQEVPIITSQATSADLQTPTGSSILQSVQYRSTGVDLSVKPIVYSESQIDLEITQSSTNAEPNRLSSVPSPVISNRSVKTSLSLADGGSVLLGGLISTNKTVSTTGVPLLKDIPILGRLFRADSETITRSEMVILIIPYVLNNTQQAEQITNAFRDKLSIIQPEQKVPEVQNPDQ